MHADYGGVVPELASRDHLRRVLPLIDEVCNEARCTPAALDAIAYTAGPGLAGALLVGSSVATALGFALEIPAVPIHHLEGHLLSPLLAEPAPVFPFVALLVSGGHTQLMRVGGVGDYALLGETLDDAAGEAFDKTAQLLGLGYPGGPALARLAERGRAGRYRLPRPLLAPGDHGALDFSFSGLKTAVVTLARRAPLTDSDRADLAAEFEAAVVDVLVAKCLAALRCTGLSQLIVAGGVGANQRLRRALDEAVAACGARVHFPAPELCTDNGAMIAHAGLLRLQAAPSVAATALAFTVRPRWELSSQRLPPATQ